MNTEYEQMKKLFQGTLTYIMFVFDARTLKEWLKWNKLHWTWGKHKKISVEEFDSWVQEWMDQNESAYGKRQ